jgi:hypothetical protein
VSSNVAPSTATVSVVHNAQFAAAYAGFHLFKPMEVHSSLPLNCVCAVASAWCVSSLCLCLHLVSLGTLRCVCFCSRPRVLLNCPAMLLSSAVQVFYQDTSNAVMGALLLNDICNPKSPALPTSTLLGNNPIALFSTSSFHGGIWRNAFTINSIGEIAATSYYLKQYKVYLAGAVAGLVAYVSWLVQP